MSKKLQLFSVLMIASVLTSLIPQSSADEGIDTIFTDGRLVGINLESDQT